MEKVPRAPCEESRTLGEGDTRVPCLDDVCAVFLLFWKLPSLGELLGLWHVPAAYSQKGCTFAKEDGETSLVAFQEKRQPKGRVCRAGRKKKSHL